MSHDHFKLREQHQTEAEQTSTQSASQSSQKGKEFATAEELLRFDAEQNPAPKAIEERLRKSIAAEPKPARRWYQKIFGG